MNAPDQSTSLTVQARASIALGAAEHEKRLVALAEQSREIVAITNAAGLQQVHASRMVLKRERIALETLGKAARDDAQKFSKAIIQEEARLIGLIEPEERRLETIENIHEAKVEAEKQAKIDAERERIAKIKAGIDEIRQIALDAIGKPPEWIAAAIEQLEAEGNGAWAQEFQGDAEAVKVQTMTRLTTMHRLAVEQEAEAKRLAAERAELEHRQAEQAEIERKAAAEREEREHRARIAAQENEARQAREAADRKARAQREAEEARLRAEREKLEKERLASEARERKAREAKEAKERARAEKEEAAERERLRKETERMDARTMLITFHDRFGHIAEFDPVLKAIEDYLIKHPETVT